VSPNAKDVIELVLFPDIEHAKDLAFEVEVRME